MHQAALAYLAAWGLVGLAVTYYYDADDQQVRARVTIARCSALAAIMESETSKMLRQ